MYTTMYRSNRSRRSSSSCVLVLAIIYFNIHSLMSSIPDEAGKERNLNSNEMVIDVLEHQSSDKNFYTNEAEEKLKKEFDPSESTERSNSKMKETRDTEATIPQGYLDEPQVSEDLSQPEYISKLEEVGEEEKSSEIFTPDEDLKYPGSDSNKNNENVEFTASKSNDLTTSDDELSDHRDQESEIGLKKQRYFPLLYTFGTLFNSFLSEFGDVSGGHDIGYNSSEKESNHSSVLNEVLNNTNVTFNSSESGKKSRFQCALRNVTENTIVEVKIVNSTELLEILNFSKNQKLSPCVLVMFYAPWCYFCARTAPHYNALARAFPQLNILAVDTSHFSYLNARFGTVAVPNVMLFHSRSAVRFNHTTRDLDHFIQYVTNNTGLEPNKSVSIEACDYEGPLSSQLVQKRDWLLWLAWAFVIVCSTYFFIRSVYGQAFIARIRVLWQEHQHIE